jgi:hypothetical protein
MYIHSKKIDLGIVESVAEQREMRFAAFIKAMTETHSD